MSDLTTVGDEGRKSADVADSLAAEGRYLEAVPLYQEALAENPVNRKLYNNLGVAWYYGGELEAARSIWEDALARYPDYLEVKVNLGACHSRLNEFEPAIRLLKEAADEQERHIGAWHNLANVYVKTGESEAAERCFQHLIQAHPDYADAYIDYGNLLRSHERFERALEQYAQASRVDAESAIAPNNLAVAFYDLGRLHEATVAFREAIARNPHYFEAHFNLAVTSMLKGDLAGAWGHFEWRQHKPEFRCPDEVARRPRWRGENLEGKTVLIYTEQGFGDAIQFARFLPVIRNLGGKVVFRCHPPLRTLMQASFPWLELAPPDDDLPVFDYQLPLLSIPFEIGLTTQKLAQVNAAWAQGAYINWAEVRGESAALRVGFAWRGNPKNAHDPARRLPLDAFRQFAELPGVRLVRLQKDDPEGEWRSCDWKDRVEDAAADLGDFSDTAGYLNGLDLVLTVDTSLAHLAGAMGKEVWVMLTHVPHWPFAFEGESSPWYPSMRLYRQKARDDWAPVLAKAAEDLAARAREISNQG